MGKKRPLSYSAKEAPQEVSYGNAGVNANHSHTLPPTWLLVLSMKCVLKLGITMLWHFQIARAFAEALKTEKGPLLSILSFDAEKE